MAEIEQVDDAKNEKESRPPSAKKPTLEEIESKSSKDWTLEDMFVLFKLDYCPDGVDEVDEEIWPKYFQQLEDSEGFDIYNFPGVCMMTSIIPMTEFEKFPEEHKTLIDLSTVAIDQFNQNQGTNYKFVKVEKSNSQGWGVGMNYYITFHAALDIDTDTSSDVVDTNTTVFQALVWEGPPWESPSLIVKFCRIKAVAA